MIGSRTTNSKFKIEKKKRNGGKYRLQLLTKKKNKQVAANKKRTNAPSRGSMTAISALVTGNGCDLR